MFVYAKTVIHSPFFILYGIYKFLLFGLDNDTYDNKYNYYYFVPLYLFSKWKQQKKYEVIANSTSLLLQEIKKLNSEFYHFFLLQKQGRISDKSAQKKYFFNKLLSINIELKAIQAELVKLKSFRNSPFIGDLKSTFKNYSETSNNFIKHMDASLKSDIMNNQSTATHQISENLSKIKFYDI